MYEQKVMRIVNNIPKDTTLIDTRWVFTTKDNGVKRARLVARGFKQRKGVNYTSTYSPTIEADSLRITISIASQYKWNLRQMDIKAAYLNAKLEEEIYVDIPEGDKNYNSGKYWILNKALYGLKQAGRQWYKEISSYLKNIGLKQLSIDQCLFTKYHNGNLCAILCLYVDDYLTYWRR